MADTGDTTSHAMSGRSRRRADGQRFWKTLPGVLTAATGLISAVAALIGGLIAAGFITASHPRATLSASSHVTGTGFPTAGSSRGGLSAGIGSGAGPGSGPGGGSGPSGRPGPGGGASPSSSPGPGGGAGPSGGPGSVGGPAGGGGCKVVATSTASTLQGTYLFDFDSGTQTQSGADVWWDQHTDTVRSLDPWSSATIVNLGAVDYGSLSCNALRSEAYASTPINGSNDATNQLIVGDVFAVHTDQGNYAKVQVISYGYNLELRFETYQAG